MTSAASFAFPPGFRSEEIAANGTTLYVRRGGNGPAVVLLHGFGDSGDMWAPLAAQLASTYTVVAPDLRGMGLSAHPEAGYEKTNQARDIARRCDQLGDRPKPVSSRTISATWSATPSPRSFPSL